MFSTFFDHMEQVDHGFFPELNIDKDKGCITKFNLGIRCQDPELIL